MTTTARTTLTRETVVSERKEETAERKGHQKTDGERKSVAVALADMFNIIILSFYHRLILSGRYLNAFVRLDTL